MRVTGIGGIFFKGHDPEKLYQWYEKHLGIVREAHGQGAAFHWREQSEYDQREGLTGWAVFPEDTKYFQPSRSAFMINYRVDDLDALLAALKQEGVEIDPHREDYDYGRFAWIMDPEGNRIELWEPPRKAPGKTAGKPGKTSKSEGARKSKKKSQRRKRRK
jgi:predicted enzyme related to lactoylglutathione lyase